MRKCSSESAHGVAENPPRPGTPPSRTTRPFMPPSGGSIPAVTIAIPAGSFKPPRGSTMTRVPTGSVWCPVAIARSFGLPGIDFDSSMAHGSFRCCLKTASAPVPSGRTVQTDWMCAQPRS
ncbi:MAG: hypothetical protein ACUVYA_17270 [Planctomycetota bacterium]